MKVLIAHTSGFCGGVKRAMGIALDAARDGGVWMDGPLVHNRQVMDRLASHGVAVGDTHAPGLRKALIRAHGVPPERRAEWLARGLDVIDATCPHVARNQRLAADAGGAVVLAGDPGHAETAAVAAAAGECVVVQTLDDIDRLVHAPALFLAQTTFDASLFAAMAERVRQRFPDAVVADTICRATHVRQEEAARLARLADAVVVVGGSHSANTRRLADAARSVGKPAFLVETAADLRPEDFASFRVVGVASGASTPGWVTQDVVDRLTGMGRDSLAGRLRQPFRTLVRSGLSTALAAAGLALAAQRQTLGMVLPLHALAAAAVIYGAGALFPRSARPWPGRRLAVSGLGWGAALVAPVWLAGGNAAAAASSLLFVVLIRIGGILIRDCHDIPSDRLLGVQTLPSRIGADRARRLADWTLVAACAVALIAVIIGLWPPIMVLFMAVPGLGREVVDAERRGWFRDGVLLRAAIDAMGVLAAALALAVSPWA